MGKFIDMTGWRMWEHGVPDSKLTVIKQAEDRIRANGIHVKRWLVECNCEKHTQFEADAGSIKSGNTTSCGCSRGYNIYDLTNDYGIGITSNTNEQFYFSLDKYDLIKQHVWRVQADKRNGYKRLVTSIHLPDGKCKIKTMWAIIAGYDYCDHKNGNTLDNRDENLRQSNHALNMQNKKTYRNNTSNESGITTRDNKYVVSIRSNNKEYHLGRYDDFDTALHIRVRAEAALFDKEYAPHRDLFEQYNIDVEYEKAYWNEWILKTGVNYLGEPTHPWQRKVIQLTLNGVYVNTFDSAAIASRQTHINHGNILSCCNHTAKSAGGFLWVFEDEYNPGETVYTYSNNTKKSVVKLSMFGEFLMLYDTVNSAAKDNGVNPSCISACCRGDQQSSGGFRWMYKEDYDKLTKQNDSHEIKPKNNEILPEDDEI